eukprot:6178736-Pleurochrysis_carterae.AAC.1
MWRQMSTLTARAALEAGTIHGTVLVAVATDRRVSTARRPCRRRVVPGHGRSGVPNADNTSKMRCTADVMRSIVAFFKGRPFLAVISYILLFP